MFIVLVCLLVFTLYLLCADLLYMCGCHVCVRCCCFRYVCLSLLLRVVVV